MASVEPLRAIARVTQRERTLIASFRREDAMGSEESQLAALLDAVRILTQSGAPYALIGGVAVGVHSGVPRATNDVDLAILSSESRIHVVAALCAAGFELAGEHP